MTKEDKMINDVREQAVAQFFAKELYVEYAKEAELLKKAKRLLSLLRKALIVRESSNPINGVADLLVCYKGNFCAFELKRIGGTPSKQQELFIESVLQAGGRAAVCMTLNDIFALLTEEKQEK